MRITTRRKATLWGELACDIESLVTIVATGLFYLVATGMFLGVALIFSVFVMSIG